MNLTPDHDFESNEIKKTYEELHSFLHYASELQQKSQSLIREFHQIKRYTPEMEIVVDNAKKLIISINEMHVRMYCI